MKTIREDIFNEIVNKNFSLLSTHGQNYLKDNDVLEKMKTYSAHTDSDILIEIGTGAGVLTSKLCETEKKVISYESDDRIYNIVKKLEKEFPNLSLIRQDFLKSALPINKKYSVIANIPYSVTSEILKKLLTNINLPEKILVMVQKEFAVKVVKCNPVNAQTIFLNTTCDCKIFSHVSKNSFFPRPRVDSCLLEIIPKNTFTPTLNYFDFLKKLFLAKRKSVKANLKINNIDFDTSVINKRPEQLSKDEFISLYNMFKVVL